MTVNNAPYQDVWLDGVPIIKGKRECEFRYHAIKKYLKKLNRPIKVLDIGANMGYFSLRLAEDFDGLFVMMECSRKISASLLKLCKLNRNNKTIFLKREFNLADLHFLAKEEHFDVVLALSIIHHFDEPYVDVLQALTTIGTHLILEPPITEETTLNQSRIINEPLNLDLYKHKELVRVPTGSVFRSKQYRKTYAISCNPKSGPMTLKYSTFVALNGIFPSPDEASHIIV